mmetsp:Transcript_10519/g.40898  ORF Transcript_10519/g.40898 Transcript_10519/m.40898 type:complete len:290 (-) Transcript_10519:14-883(-)
MWWTSRAGLMRARASASPWRRRSPSTCWSARRERQGKGAAWVGSVSPHRSMVLHGQCGLAWWAGKLGAERPCRSCASWPRARCTLCTTSLRRTAQAGRLRAGSATSPTTPAGAPWPRSWRRLRERSQTLPGYPGTRPRQPGPAARRAALQACRTRPQPGRPRRARAQRARRQVRWAAVRRPPWSTLERCCCAAGKGRCGVRRLLVTGQPRQRRMALRPLRRPSGLCGPWWRRQPSAWRRVATCRPWPRWESPDGGLTARRCGHGQWGLLRWRARQWSLERGPRCSGAAR